MEPIMVALIGISGSIAVAVLGAFFSRRWGLPGIAREVQNQQAALIITLQQEIAILRTKVDGFDQCRQELEDMRRRVSALEHELLSQYRDRPKAKPDG